MHNYLSFEYNVLNSINRIKQVNLSGGGLWEPSHPLEQWNRDFRGFPGPNGCLALLDKFLTMPLKLNYTIQSVKISWWLGSDFKKLILF